MPHDYPATAGLSGVTMDVSALVSQMNETLSTIHSTIASLKTTGHDSRLDDLERQRDLAISSLHKAFDQEDTVLSQRRQAERDEIAQRRRREDEELERRRRLEDEELAEKQIREDDERRARLEGKARGVEEETDEQMGVVEEEAQRMLDEGRDKLRLLEEKRQELNRLIDEQLKIALPAAPKRRRSMRASAHTPPPVAAESKPPAPALADEHVGNNLAVKAPEENGNPDGKVPRLEKRLALAEWLRRNEATRKDQEKGRPHLEDARNHSPVRGGSTSVLTTEEDGQSTGSLPVLEEMPESESSQDPKPEHADLSHRAETPLSKDQTPEPKSLFGSWGKTMRSLVSSQPSSSRTALPDGQGHPPGVPDLDHDRSVSAPGSYPTEEEPTVTGPIPELQTSPEVSPAETLGEKAIEQGRADVDIEMDASEIGNGNDIAGQAVDATLATGDQEAFVEDGDLPVKDDHHVTPVTEKHEEVEEAICSADETLSEKSTISEETARQERLFGMSGNEAIPGTMTHGSADSGSDIVEPIPGTMTHRNDFPTLAQEIPSRATDHADPRYCSADGHSNEAFAPARETVDVQELVGSPTTHSLSHGVSIEDLPGSLACETLDSMAEASPRFPEKVEHMFAEPSEPAGHLISAMESDGQPTTNDNKMEVLQPEDLSPAEILIEETSEVAEATSSEPSSPVEHTLYAQDSPSEDTLSGLEPESLHPDMVREVPDLAPETQLADETGGGLVDQSALVIDGDHSEEEIEHGSEPYQPDEVDQDGPTDQAHEEIELVIHQRPDDPAEQMPQPEPEPQESYQSSCDESSVSSASDGAETYSDLDTTVELLPLPSTQVASAEHHEPAKATSEPEAEAEPEPEPAADPKAGHEEDDPEPKPTDSTACIGNPASDSDGEVPRAEACDEAEPGSRQVGSQDIVDRVVEEPELGVAGVGEEEVPLEDVQHVRADQTPGSLQAGEVEGRLDHAPESVPYSPEAMHYSASEEIGYHGDGVVENQPNVAPSGDEHEPPEEVDMDGVSVSDHPPIEDNGCDVVGGGEWIETSQHFEPPGNQGDDPSHLCPAFVDGDLDNGEERRVDDQSESHMTTYGQVEEFSRLLRERDTGQSPLGLVDSNADSGSQPFVTPLASAGFRSPPLNSEDELIDAEEESSQADEYNSHYELEDDHTTTVHGQDDLFDDDDHSDEHAEHTSDDEREALGHDFHDDGDPSVKEHVITSHLGYVDDEPITAVPAGPEQRSTSGPGESQGDEGHLTISTAEWADDPIDSYSDLAAMEFHPRAEEGHADEARGDHIMDSPTVGNPPTPHFRPTRAPLTPEAVSLALRYSTPYQEEGGLANSRHNPDRPRTPQRNVTRDAVDEGLEAESFVIRDVTNVPWHSRNDSIPRSLHSQSTISSSPLSSTHSPLRSDSHEPAIHDGSPAHAHSHLLSGMAGRPRNDSQPTTYDHFGGVGGYDAKAVAAQWLRRESSDASPAPPARAPSPSPQPGSLFQKMRSIFEQQQTDGANDRPPPPLPLPLSPQPRLTTWSGKGNPVRSRPISGVSYIPVRLTGPPRDLGRAAAHVGLVDGEYGDYGYRMRVVPDGGDDEGDERSGSWHEETAQEDRKGKGVLLTGSLGERSSGIGQARTVSVATVSAATVSAATVSAATVSAATVGEVQTTAGRRCDGTRAEVEDRRVSVLSVRTEVSIDDASSTTDDSDSETALTSECTEQHDVAWPDAPKKRGRVVAEAGGDFRLAWVWVEGWRARLRKSGDVVEKARWEFRLDDAMLGRAPNRMPVIVARVPGVSALKGSEVRVVGPGEVRRKSVHWA
ncbi:hypothetical protein QBC33DRAFT_516339 [Phialemonium atrogriseum]|uniref:Uncharacterized protein n=1 Tax=Phialemonium atrogriseum TaxID=1093897 RepID=A0AAJ0C1E3_9PEZI|nr:uncharacterized protein QBC33DRAFT_516339 [Phialemonium atrogriseum]KAK1765921.1 hypothetical protein QBC33DRAFT_516339 [Phialemonium atrogriseum]